MLYDDPRPISLLTGPSAVEAISKLSTNRLSVNKENNVDRAVVCDGSGRVLDAPHIVWDESGVILLHTTSNKPDYLKSVARTLSKRSGQVMDATGAIDRFLCHRDQCPDQAGLVIDNLGVMGKYSIVLNPTRSEKWTNTRLTPEVLIEIGGLTDDHLKGRYLPHHIGLSDYVRLDNGCYPGQEIHARMDSRNPNKKKMIWIEAEDPPIQNSLIISGFNCKFITPSGRTIVHGIIEDSTEEGFHDTATGTVNTLDILNAL